MSSISFIIQACRARAQHTRRIHKSKIFFIRFSFSIITLCVAFLYIIILSIVIDFFFHKTGIEGGKGIPVHGRGRNGVTTGPPADLENGWFTSFKPVLPVFRFRAYPDSVGPKKKKTIQKIRYTKITRWTQKITIVVRIYIYNIIIVTSVIYRHGKTNTVRDQLKESNARFITPVGPGPSNYTHEYNGFMSILF